MKAIVLAAIVLLVGLTPARAVDITAPEVSVTFVSPDGSSATTSLTVDEGRQLQGKSCEYSVECWIQAARTKLFLPVVLYRDDGMEAKSVVSMATAVRGDDQTWTLPNETPGIPHISVAYERETGAD